MNALRIMMHPVSLNMLLFLKENRHLWPNASIIQKILNGMNNYSIDDDANEPGIVEDEDDREKTYIQYII